MFWYVMLMLLSPLYLVFGLLFRSEQARLVLALYQQVLILQRQLGRRPSVVQKRGQGPLQLLLQRNDSQTLLTSVQEQQRNYPEEKLHEHPLTPRLRSGTWEVRRAPNHNLGKAERIAATTGLILSSIESALHSPSGIPTGICGLHITRRDVAGSVGYSPSYLGRLISAYLGRSVSEYLLSLQITEGKRLLAESDATVTEIATSVGYADRAHFTRAFTRVTGLSPTAYRQQFGPR